MRNNYIIADSGATKCQWTLVIGKQKKTVTTIGISPYFMSTSQIIETIQKGFQKKSTQLLLMPFIFMAQD
jgi:hypothetical protein